MKFSSLLVFVAVLCIARFATAKFMWSGAVTDTSASIRAVGYKDQTFVVSESSDLANPLFTTTITVDFADITITGLNEDSLYYYGIPSSNDVGAFLTFKIKKPLSFTAVVGSCGETGSVSESYLRAAELFPHIVIHMGDLHYEDIDTDDVTKYNDAYERVHSSYTQRTLYRNIPIAYMWDDHDFRGNNKVGDGPGRTAARTAYQNNVPHYPLGINSTGDVPIYQAWTIGRVRFVMPDLKSTATANTNVMDETQMNWFLNELSQAADYGLVVIVSSQPWVIKAGGDGWSTAEKTKIANFIVEKGINNVVLVAGDAHMLAIDDGSHSDYSDNGGAGFPVFQAAAWDRPGSSKGGPYSHGCYTEAFRSQQYGVFSVEDDGSKICFTWEGHSVDSATPLVVYEACTPTTIKGEAGNLDFCTLTRPAWEWGVLAVECAIAAGLLIIVLVLPPRPPGRKRYITAAVFGASFIVIAVVWGVVTGPEPVTFYACLIVLAGVDVIFAVVVALLFTIWKEDGDKKNLDSELQRINKTRPSVSQTTNPIQPTTKVPDHESGSEESDEEEDEDEDSEEEDDEEEDEEEEEDEDDSSDGSSSSGGPQRPAMIAKPSNTGLQAASESGSGSEVSESDNSEQSSSEGSSGSNESS
jgi:hypothetical protein